MPGRRRAIAAAVFAGVAIAAVALPWYEGLSLEPPLGKTAGGSGFEGTFAVLLSLQGLGRRTAGYEAGGPLVVAFLILGLGALGAALPRVFRTVAWPRAAPPSLAALLFGSAVFITLADGLSSRVAPIALGVLPGWLTTLVASGVATLLAAFASFSAGQSGLSPTMVGATDTPPPSNGPDLVSRARHRRFALLASLFGAAALAGTAFPWASSALWEEQGRRISALLVPSSGEPSPAGIPDVRALLHLRPADGTRSGLLLGGEVAFVLLGLGTGAAATSRMRPRAGHRAAPPHWSRVTLLASTSLLGAGTVCTLLLGLALKVPPRSPLLAEASFGSVALQYGWWLSVAAGLLGTISAWVAFRRAPPDASALTCAGEPGACGRPGSP